MKRIKIEILNFILIILGILSAGMGLKGFLLSSNFIDGGVTGVSMLLAKISNLPLYFWLPLVNLPFIIVGYRSMGRIFAIRSVFGMAGLAIVLACIPYPDVTPDLVLTAIFGGFFLGAGIGLAVRGGAVLDGTEIAALIISKWTSILKVGDVILIFNVVLFLIAMSVLGVDAALYSILTYITAAKTLDFVLHGIDEYTAITIVSDQNTLIRKRIINELGRGITVYKGAGGMTNVKKNILYCVVTRLEIGKIKSIVDETDKKAFMIFYPLSDVKGGIVKKITMHN